MHLTLAIALLCLLTGCSEPPMSPRGEWREVPGRDVSLSENVYRVRVPEDWLRTAVNPERLVDTTQPVGRFAIVDGESRIDIFIHNFPSDSLEQRIPAEAQVARWQRQTGDAGSVTAFAHGGYVGWQYEGDGVMAWALQLAPEHYRALSRSPKDALQRQQRADVTIKATGPNELIARHRDSTIAFARNFELIIEIPATPR